MHACAVGKALIIRTMLVGLLCVALLIAIAPIFAVEYEIVAVPGSTPNIDGQIFDPMEWNDASTTTFNDITVYVKQDGKNLYIAFIIPDDTIQYHLDRCSICIDVNNDKGGALQSDDIGLSVGRDGTLIEVNVTGGSFTPTDVSNWTAKAYSGKDEFHAEFNITYAKIDVTAGVAKTIGVAFIVLDYYTPESSVPFFWPPTASESPSTWGSITSNEYNWIPEFPSAMVLPLFMALSLIAIVLAKRRIYRKLEN